MKRRVRGQEPIIRSIHLPYSVCETASSQVELFLDIRAFMRISSQWSDLFILLYIGFSHQDPNILY